MASRQIRREATCLSKRPFAPRGNLRELLRRRLKMLDFGP
jgi:hypothetical protein